MAAHTFAASTQRFMPCLPPLHNSCPGCLQPAHHAYAACAQRIMPSLPPLHSSCPGCRHPAQACSRTEPQRKPTLDLSASPHL